MQKKSKLGVLAVACVMLALAIPAGAGEAQVTTGDLVTFADGAALGYDVSGHVVMVRNPQGTSVILVANGLEPGATYGSHVHDKACGDASAGGHYRFETPVPGGALGGFEIWPGPFTANPAGRANGKTMVGAVAGQSAMSVVIHAPTGQKIACADLS